MEKNGYIDTMTPWPLSGVIFVFMGVICNAMGSRALVNKKWTRKMNDPVVICLTAALSAVYFGSGKFLKSGISPIGLIGISAAAGMIVFGIL